MTTASLIMTCFAALAFFVGSAVPVSAIDAPQASRDKAQISILYDGFGKEPALKKDWGYAAFVEYGGKGILFDTVFNPFWVGWAPGARLSINSLEGQNLSSLQPVTSLLHRGVRSVCLPLPNSNPGISYRRVITR